MTHDPKNWTVILVSGAWHVAFHCLPPAPYFESAGYNYIPVPLPAAGGLNSTLEENVSAIYMAMISELRKPRQQVAMVFHSAAGLIGTEAVNRVLSLQPSYCQRVRILYLAAVFDYAPIVSHLAGSGNLRVDHDIDSFWCDQGYTALYQGDMSEMEAQPYVNALTFHAIMGKDLVLTSGAWRSSDLTYVVCQKDKVVPEEWQVKVAEEFGMKIVNMETAHCPFVTKPKEFAEVVQGVLGEDVSPEVA